MELSIYVKMAKTRICSLYSDTAGSCYLSFSGGKDSTIVLALIKELQEEGRIRENAIPAVYADTGIELQATKDFVEWVKENYYGNVQTINSEKSFAQIIKEYGKPFRNKMKSELLERYRRNPNLKSVKNLYDPEYSKSKRFYLANRDMHILHPNIGIKISNQCCEYMKKRPFKHYAKENDILGVIVGVRAAEGGSRQYQYDKAIEEGKSPCTYCDEESGITKKMPIVDWSDEICEEFIRNHNVPLSKAYTEYGCDRTGCFLCPFGKNKEKELKMLFIYEPKQYKAAMHWMKDIFIAQNFVLPFDKEYERERESLETLRRYAI